MNYLMEDDEDEFAATIGEAMERSREREARGRIEETRARAAAPVTKPTSGKGDGDEDYLAWQEDSDPMAPGNSAPSRASAFDREARMAERDGDTAGAESMRASGAALPPADMEFTEEEVYGTPDVFEREAEMAERDGDAAGAAAMRGYGHKGAKGADEEAADYLAGLEAGALDAPFVGSTANDTRGREASDELEALEEPDARRELFESTPTGPGAIHHPDGTVTRTPARPALRDAAPPEDEGRFVPLPDDVYAAMESEPINEIDMSAMEPMVITADDEAAPDINDESGYWGTATDEDPTYPGHERTEGDLSDIEAAALEGADDTPATLVPATEPVLSYRDPAEAEDVDAFVGGLEGGADALAPAAFGKTPTAPGSDPLALDANLPTEGDISGARVRDGFGQFFGRIGNALRVAGGGAHRDIEQEAPGLEEARREGLAERVGAKGATELADRRAARAAADAERLAEVRNTPSRLELDREARLAAADERDAGIASRRLDLTERELASDEAGSAAERASEAAMRDPASRESAQARERLGAALEGLPARLRAAITEGHDLSRMSAADVAALERSIPAFARGELGRGRGGGTGGGGAATTPALRARLISEGMSEEEADAALAALGPRRVAASLLTDTLSSGRAAETAERRAAHTGNELIAGVHATVPMSAPRRTAWQNGWDDVRGRMDALRSIEAIAAEAGPTAVIDPEVAARLEPYMMSLRGMAAAAQGTGVINPSEMPAINAALPDATSMAGMTLGRFQGALREWRNLVESSIRHQLEDYGVSEEEASMALSALRSGGRTRRSPASSGSAPAADAVRMRAPDGRVVRVPANRVEAAIAAGGEVVE